MTLEKLGIGSSAIITKVGGGEAIRQHLLDMGVIPGIKVTAVKRAPLGDPLGFFGFSVAAPGVLKRRMKQLK